MVIIQNKQSLPVDIATLDMAATHALHFLGYDAFDLSIVLVTNDEMQRYNKEFRSLDKPTDVLSFPFFPDIAAGERIVALSEDEENLGDIIIAPLYVKEHLAQWYDTFDHRMLVLLVHGLCHLLGYDHIEDDDFALMDAQEKKLLAYIEENL